MHKISLRNHHRTTHMKTAAIKTMVCLFIIFAALIFAPNSYAAKEHHPPTAKSKPIIHVGFGAERPPFVFKNHTEGLEVELIYALCDEMGYQIEADFIPNARGYQYLNQKRIDLYTTITESSKGDAYLSQPYIKFENVLISKQDKPTVISFNQLINARITAFQNAKVFIPEIKAIKDQTALYLETATQHTQVILLYRDRVDYVFSERRIFEYYYQQAIMNGEIPENGFAYKIHHVREPTLYSAGFHDPELRDRFDIALKTIKENGTYQRIIDKYDTHN